ncbi:hypothetical protein V5799_017078 [Amblyomma americanum]|uniref:Uncharacterized protein n=1 Tax=Amblyomma americanum TaxID=6943 RepID=A0AAQ4F4B7_AMBAM
MTLAQQTASDFVIIIIHSNWNKACRFRSFRVWISRAALQGAVLRVCHNGKDKEPHQSQPEPQGPQEWHQAAQEGFEAFHARGGCQVCEEHAVCQAA